MYLESINAKLIVFLHAYIHYVILIIKVQMKRAEEFEVWERNKRKEQKYIRTKNCTTKVYYLPKNHNDSTLTALENTMDEIDEEIRVAREVFEEELQKISTRAEQNPTAVSILS